MGTKTDPELIAHFARNLKQLRKSRKLTQEELAEMAGLHPLTISRFENGHLQAGLSALVSLTSSLECRFVDLLPHEPDAEERGLSDGERGILERWRRLSPDSRAALVALLDSFESTESAE